MPRTESLEPWKKREPGRLAEYVWPRAAARLVGRIESGDATLHDLRRRDPRQLVGLLYQHLVGLRIPYAPMEIDVSKHRRGEQPIRPPWELADQGANCLEASLLLAGVCQHYLMRPLVVLLDQHALVAVWLGGDLSRTIALGRSGPSDFRFLDQGLILGSDHALAKTHFLASVDEGEYLVVEATGFTRSQENGPTGQLSFEAACQAARARLASLDVVNIVDVAWLQRAEVGYRPLPEPALLPASRSPDRLGVYGTAKVRDRLARLSRSVGEPEHWTAAALQELLDKTHDLPDIDRHELATTVDSLTNALDGVARAREAMPDVLTSAHLRRALTGMTDRVTHPPLAEDVDYFSYVALNSPVVLGDSRKSVVTYLLHLAVATETDLAAVTSWAHETAGRDFVNRTLEEVKAKQTAARVRLIISLHTSRTGDWPYEVIGWLMDGKTLLAGPKIIACAPTQADNEAAVTRVLLWGLEEAAHLGTGSPLRNVDLVPPARHVLQWRPDQSILDGVLGSDHDTVTRWSYRLDPPARLLGGLIRSFQRQDRVRGGDATAPIDWLAEAEVAHVELARLLERCQQAIGLTFTPSDRHDLLETLLDHTPVLVWPTDGTTVDDETKDALAQSWPVLPRGFAAAYRSGGTPSIAGLRALWDDSDWLAFCLRYGQPAGRGGSA